MTRRFWNRARLGALLPYVIVGALLVVTIVIVGRDIDRHIDAIAGRNAADESVAPAPSGEGDLLIFVRRR